jgi:TetR/AcrR family transcriptional repressor of nem operon
VTSAAFDSDMIAPESALMAIAMIELHDERKAQSDLCDMRVSKHQAAENRERILLAASRLLRERGVSGAGGDALSDAAGMTHGSLYSQFGSKGRLVQEALTHALTAKELEAREIRNLKSYVAKYLSRGHRDAAERGCPIAALCCEMPRQSTSVRDRFTAGLRGMVANLSGRMDPVLKQRKRDQEAMATVASLVGAIVLARAVNDPDLSNDILHATRRRLKA